MVGRPEGFSGDDRVLDAFRVAVADRVEEVRLTSSSYRAVTGINVERSALSALRHQLPHAWGFPRLRRFGLDLGVDVEVTPTLLPVPDRFLPSVSAKDRPRSVSRGPSERLRQDLLAALAAKAATLDLAAVMDLAASLGVAAHVGHAHGPSGTKTTKA